MDGLVMETVTPGRIPPVASVILPLMAPVVALTVWPNVAATEPNASTRTKTGIRQCSSLMLLPVPTKMWDLRRGGKSSVVERTLHPNPGQRNRFCRDRRRSTDAACGILDRAREPIRRFGLLAHVAWGPSGGSDHAD